jgi:hypothetical protein
MEGPLILLSSKHSPGVGLLIEGRLAVRKKHPLCSRQPHAKGSSIGSLGPTILPMPSSGTYKGVGTVVQPLELRFRALLLGNDFEHVELARA